MSYNVRRLSRTAAVVSTATVLAGLSAQAAVAATDSSLACEVPPERDLAVTKEMHQAASQQGVDDKVLLASFEAGWVASHANNLDCGQDGLGVFKQGPGEWCDSDAQCRDVTHVTTYFLERGTAALEEDPSQSAGEVAARVMGSAYPDRYDEAEDKAKSLIAEAEKES